MKLTKIIREADYFPRGYGVAWRVWHQRDTYVCLPIPLNVIARAARNAFFWVREASFGRIREDTLASAYQLGYDDGRAAALAKSRRMPLGVTFGDPLRGMSDESRKRVLAKMTLNDSEGAE